MAEAYLEKIRAIVSNKKCILYGFGDMGKNILITLESIKVDVAYIVDRNYESYKSMEWSLFHKKYEVRDPYELGLENAGEVCILVTVGMTAGGADEIRSFLLDFGFKRDKDFYLLDDLISANYDYIDPTLGYTRIYPLGMAGFEIYGDKNAAHKIITLGGSTTDPTTYLVKSWSEILYEMIGRDDVCVYNGGMGGYDSFQELLKCIRDVSPLKPELLICYSGYNDLIRLSQQFSNNDYPYVPIYMQRTMKKLLAGYDAKISFGIPTDLTPAEAWVRNQTIMHSIAEILNISHFSILQPCLACAGKDYIFSETEVKRVGLEAKSLFDSFRNFYDEIESMNLFSAWMIDGRNIFGASSGLFYDRCHVNEEGNRLIAKFVLNIIHPKL